MTELSPRPCALTERPAKVGTLEGDRRRFTFRNLRAEVTPEVAAVSSGSARRDREFSAVLA